MQSMTDEMFWILALALLSLGLLLICIVQHRQIEHLKSRRRPSYYPVQADEAPLTYLREHLTDMPKIEAIKALRQQYPGLTLVEAVRLWEQR